MPNGWMARVREEPAGSVIIEFAFTLPFLLLVIMGAVDFGFALRKELLVTSAAREGARMAVLPGYISADVEAYVIDYLSDRGVTGAEVDPVENVSITPGVGLPFFVKRVTVRVDHAYAYLAPIAGLFGGSFGTTTLEESAVMRTEIHAAGGP
jgi:hypothetical protein